MNNAYLCDIRNRQNISGNLSTFPSHIKELQMCPPRNEKSHYSTMAFSVSKIPLSHIKQRRAHLCSNPIYGRATMSLEHV